MFQFPSFPPYDYLIHRTVTGSSPVGFPHSDIRGSRLICSSPRLFAACHVLLRLLMPRHSPYALFCLNFLLLIALSFANNLFTMKKLFRCFSFFGYRLTVFPQYCGQIVVFHDSFRKTLILISISSSKILLNYLFVSLI